MTAPEDFQQQAGRPPSPRNPRRVHDDSGASLSPKALRHQKVYIDVEASLTRAIVRLGNALEKYPEIGDRPKVDSWLERLKEVAAEVRAGKPEAPCVFCLAAVAKNRKAPCSSCGGLRWMTKRALGEAPAELRAAAGLP